MLQFMIKVHEMTPPRTNYETDFSSNYGKKKSILDINKKLKC